VSGCVAWNELTQGVAIWPFVLGIEVHTEDLASFRGTQVVVVVADVEGGELPDEFPVSGAEVEVVGPTGAEATLVERAEGVYVITAVEEPELHYEVGGTYAVEAVVDGESYRASSAAASLLDTHWTLESHPTGADLEISFPAGYEDEYDQVLVQVLDTTGAAVWSNWPESAQEWLEFAAARYTPANLTIPGATFADDASLYGVALLGAVRSRDEADFSESLTSALSGYTTGSGYAEPLVTELP
jgi:hypothetical protein